MCARNETQSCLRKTMPLSSACRSNFGKFSLLLFVLVIISLCLSPSSGNPEAAASGGEDCSGITRDSPWEEQIPIRPCHYEKDVHPRQVPREDRTPSENKAFQWLGFFNIRYDLDFIEAGKPCSTRLHHEWLTTQPPRSLEAYSFTGTWHERLCNFFSYLECIPKNETRVSAIQRTDKKSILANAAATDPPLTYKSSGRNTSGLEKVKIGGRGPGKGRRKSESGKERVKESDAAPSRQKEDVDLVDDDGICVCHAFDPKYPDRKLMDYGMDFVEDELREEWCVAAPGNLCGRVYFRKNVWPGQNFHFSDHISCPKRHNGHEYECIRWTRILPADATYDYDNPPNPSSKTSTCEQKIENPEITRQKKKKKEPSTAGSKKLDSSYILEYFVTLLTVLASNVDLSSNIRRNS